MLADHPPSVVGEPETIAKLLTRLRIERGYTQSQLAARLCDASGSVTITRHELSRWERGGRVPGSVWRRWLAVVLEVPQEQLEAAVATTRARRQPRQAPPRKVGKASALAAGERRGCP